MFSAIGKVLRAVATRIFDFIRRILNFKTPVIIVFRVKDRFLYDNEGVKIILRGVNLPLLDDWDFPGSHKLAEIERTGANAVRIQWYKQYPNPARPAHNVADLSHFLDTCRKSRMIPIVELHDFTCAGNTDLVNTQLMAWWTDPAVLMMLASHQRYLIINLANELGSYDGSLTSLHAFRDAYKTAIKTIRNHGLKMPIMIDAPNCGTSIAALKAVGNELVNHDDEHNILLSVHSYWAASDGTPDIAPMVAANLPLVFGEIANKQFNNGDECFYGIDGTGLNHAPPTGFRYQDLLQLLAQQEIGWLAWAWFKDNCPARRMSTDGNYTGALDGSPTGLTPYGQDLVENPIYGLRLGTAKAVRSGSLPGAPPA